MRNLTYICDWCGSITKNGKEVRTINIQDFGFLNKLDDEICISCAKLIQELKQTIQGKVL